MALGHKLGLEVDPAQRIKILSSNICLVILFRPVIVRYKRSLGHGSDFYTSDCAFLCVFVYSIA